MTDILLEAGEEDIQLDEHEKTHEENENKKDLETNNKNKKDLETNNKNKNNNNNDEGGRIAKGRGFERTTSQKRESAERYAGKGGQFETLTNLSSSGVQRSVEGYIIFIRNIHEEATDDVILDRFSEFGEIKNLQIPLDRKTGYVKGYCLLEYENLEEAENAVKEMDGNELMDLTLSVDFAFKTGNEKREKRKYYHRH